MEEWFSVRFEAAFKINAARRPAAKDYFAKYLLEMKNTLALIEKSAISFLRFKAFPKSGTCAF